MRSSSRRHRAELKDLLARMPLRKATWREGTKEEFASRFAWLRVRPAHRWAAGDDAGVEPPGLLIEVIAMVTKPLREPPKAEAQKGEWSQRDPPRPAAPRRHGLA
jgi:hypothetical protein